MSPLFTTATDRIRPNFRSRRLLQVLIGGYGLLWMWLAIAPVDRKDWLLENLLVVVLVGVLAATYRVFPMSDMSYVLLATFLTLHAVGAHYTYAKVPAGFWVRDAFHLSRNHYDRFVHLCWGLLMAYPFRELFLRVANAHGFWAYYLPLDVTLAFSAMFELIEAWAAQIVSPELGDAYLGTQGDIWDAQNDMTAAIVGAVICLGLTALLHRLLNKGQQVKSPVKP